MKITVEGREAEVVYIDFRAGFVDFRFTGKDEYQGDCKLPLDIKEMEKQAPAIRAAVEKNTKTEFLREVEGGRIGKG